MAEITVDEESVVKLVWTCVRRTLSGDFVERGCLRKEAIETYTREQLQRIQEARSDRAHG